MRVNAQLIDARNDAHLWAQTYDRDLADVFAIQSEIAKAIADQLQAKLSPAEKNAIEQRPTTDVAAFELYSRAKDLILNTGFSAIRAQNVRSGIDLLNQALSRDPSFFAAQCQLAYAHDQLYPLDVDHTPERLALAEAAVQAAFRLRPDAGEAHLARADHLYFAYRDYDGALAELEVVREHNAKCSSDFRIDRVHRPPPRSARGRVAQSEARGGIGSAEFLHASAALDKLRAASSLSRCHCHERSRLGSIKPDDPETKAARDLAYLDWKADTRPLHQAIDEIRAQEPEAVKSIADLWFICALAERDAASAEMALTELGDATFGDNQTQLTAAFGRGLLARMMKDESKARAAFAAIRPEQEKIVQEQSDFGPAVCTLALIDAGLGRKEEALRESRRAVELVPLEKDALTERT